MQPSMTQFLSSLTALQAMCATPGLCLRSVALEGAASLDVKTSETTINQVALTAFVNLMQAYFNLDAAKFRESLTPDVSFVFTRLRGGFEVGDKTEGSGAEKLSKFSDEKFFNITSNFKVNKMSVTINGLTAETVTDIEEDKVIDGQKGRYHMICTEYFRFNEEGKLAEIRARNTMNKIS